MNYVKVYIEEHLNREIEIEVPDGIEDPDEYALDKAREMYRNEEIVLYADDHTTTLIAMENTEWEEI